MRQPQAEEENADLSGLGRQFESNEAAMRDLTADLTGEQLNWRPDHGRAWSILQCVQHLALSGTSDRGALQPAVDGARGSGPRRRGPIGASAPGRLFRSRLEPPVKAKIAAPKAIVPAERLDKDEVVAGYLRNHDQIRKLLADAGEMDFNRVKFRNPLLPLLRVRAGTGLMIIAAHERRHLWQARQVRELLDQTLRG